MRNSEDPQNTACCGRSNWRAENVLKLSGREFILIGKKRGMSIKSGRM